MIENKVVLKEKVKEAFTKVGKRNLIIVLSLLLIGGAVFVNWRFFSNGNKDTAVDNEIADLDSEQGDPQAEVTQSFYAVAQINRQRARDEAIEVFQLVVDSDTALEESKASAIEGINRIAANIETEANIESLIRSKGFNECVAVIGDDSAEIIVQSSGLLDNEIVQIQEIVYEQSGIVPANVKIIENQENR